MLNEVLQLKSYWIIEFWVRLPNHYNFWNPHFFWNWNWIQPIWDLTSWQLLITQVWKLADKCHTTSGGRNRCSATSWKSRPAPQGTPLRSFGVKFSHRLQQWWLTIIGDVSISVLRNQGEEGAVEVRTMSCLWTNYGSNFPCRRIATTSLFVIHD